jgi:uncharacterized protein (TIGR02996 family)
MTFQIRETLIHRGLSRDVWCDPLASYEGDRKVPDFGVVTSACWRGYVGTWEVRDDALYLLRLDEPFGDRSLGSFGISTGGAFLLRLDEPFGDGSVNGLDEMFPGHGGSVEATWFSGEVVPDDVGPGDPALAPFALVFRRGKLLLEEDLDGEGRVVRSRLTGHVGGLFNAQECGFLQSLRADLNDPTPRLVYADWLEEQGDPRGAELRAEVEHLAREGPLRGQLGSGRRQDLPSGAVDADDRLWFWRRLAACGPPEGDR